MPARAAADAVAAALTVAAGACAAWVLARHGYAGTALVALAAGSAAGIGLAIRWSRARSQPAWGLTGTANGELWLRRDDVRTQIRVGRATRVLGPSVFLDLRAANPGVGVRYRRWLTPLDLPPDTLRRLTLVLPRSGRDAGS